MSLTDPVADMATIIRNASAAGKENAEIKASRVNEKILDILKTERFIQNYKKMDTGKQGIFKIYFLYSGRTPRIRNIERVSRPGLRVYKKKDEITPILGGLGIAILSTSQGLMTDGEARKRNIGGEIMLKVW